MPTYHIVYESWPTVAEFQTGAYVDTLPSKLGQRQMIDIRAAHLHAALIKITRDDSLRVRSVISAEIVEKRTRATRMRKWDARDVAEEMRQRYGWRRLGMANERVEGRQLDRDFPRKAPIFTPPNIARWLHAMTAHRTTAKPKSADRAEA